MIDRKLMLSHLSSLSEKAKKEPGHRSIIKESPSIGKSIASGLAATAGGIGGGMLGGAVGGPVGAVMGGSIGAGLAQGAANKTMRLPTPPPPEDPKRPFGKGPKITGGVEVGGVPTSKGLVNTAKEIINPRGLINPTNLVGMGIGIPVQQKAEELQSKALSAVGIKDPDTQWYLSQPGSWAAGGAPAGALSGALATKTVAGTLGGALGGAAAGGAAGLGAAAGWGAARGLIHASDALGITDNMADKPTNPFGADYVPIWSSKPAPVEEPDEDLQRWNEKEEIENKNVEIRKNSEAGYNRREQMRAILRGETPDMSLNTQYTGYVAPPPNEPPPRSKTATATQVHSSGK